MSISDDIKNATKFVRYPEIVGYLEDMVEDDRKAVVDAICGNHVSAAQLANILTKNGYPIKPDSIKSLRRGDTKSISLDELREKFS